MSADILLLDSNLNVCGMADDYNSLVWSRRYFSLGDFTVTLPDKYFSQAKSAAYVYSRESGNIGIIEKYVYSVSSDGNILVTVSGRLCEALLDFRIIDGVYIVSGSLESQVYSLVSRCAIEGDRAVPGLTLAPTQGIDLAVSSQAFGSSLSSFLYDLLAPYGLSYSITYSDETRSLVFSLEKGFDRTQNQSANQPAVFSTSFENFSESKFSFNNKNFANLAYVFGSGSTEERKKVEVDLTGDGESRREIFVSASDISKKIPLGDGIQKELTDAEYSALLSARGSQILAVRKKTLSVSGRISTFSPPLYKKDFDLGDICCCEIPSVGLSAELRLTEIRETYENGGVMLDAVFSSENE